MKKYLISLIAMLCATLCQAQQFNRIYLFDEFQQGEILFKNKQTSKLAINYDASNRTLLFRQGDDIMEVTNTALVDTVYMQGHKFIPMGKCLYEVVALKNGTAYIDWLLKDVQIGKRGALGAVTQGTVYNLQMTDFGNYDAMYYTPYGSQKIGVTDVYNRTNDNTYYIRLDGKLVKVKTEKQLQKLFPSHKDDISDFCKQNKINMKETPKVLMLIDHCLGFGKQ